MTIDKIEVLGLGQDALHGLTGALLLPVTGLRGHQMHTRIGLQGIHKTAMALQSRGRAIQSAYLHHTPLSLQTLGYELSHGLAYHVIVTAYEGGILF